MIWILVGGAFRIAAFQNHFESPGAHVVGTWIMSAGWRATATCTRNDSRPQDETAVKASRSQ